VIAATTEGIAHVNGIEIAYETLGDTAAPALLLIMGLGMPLTWWDDDLCAEFVEQGFHVIRFDNRDTGRSTKITGGPRPIVLESVVGITRTATYALEDMAADAAGLLRHLSVERAHVLGVSLGGMIGQTLALDRPECLLSLASLMSTTGSRRVGQPRPRAALALLKRPPHDREGYVDHLVRTFGVVGSPGFERDEAGLRARLSAGFDRGHDPSGVARQLLAVAASGDRTRALRRVNVPTVVIHGHDDPLVPVRAGRATARAIPGARLVEIAGMGHDLPRPVWPQIIEAVVDNAARAAA
jgi:pimeloyl-ACP methyl ester carboxylesterase